MRKKIKKQGMADKIWKPGGSVKAPCKSVMMALLLSSSLIPHLSSLSWAAHPFITDDTGTQGKGNWQLELQGDFLRDDRTAAGVERKDKVNSYTSVLSYGILENLDVQVGVSYVSTRTTENGMTIADESGMGDSTIEIKWRFYENNGFSLGLKPALLLPTGNEDKGLGTGKTSWGVTFLATWEVEPWTFLGNVAYSHVRFKDPATAADSRSDLWRVSGGATYELTDGWRLAGELGLRSNESKNDAFLPDSTGQFGMLGVIWSPTKKIDLDAGFRRTFNSGDARNAYLVGATFRW